MSFGTDIAGYDKVCLSCDTPTKSHPAPNGYLCHSCTTELPEAELLETIGVQRFETVDRETEISCWWCDSEYKITEGRGTDGPAVRVGDGFPLFDSYPGLIISACPVCTRSTETVTQSAAAAAFADTIGVPVMSYSVRAGWEVAE
jgi:hypothetical protein